jgi:predicted AlkP superfamily phosphohydrolase/phosphomutase
VSPGAEADALKKELAQKLTGFRDEEKNQIAIREAYPKEAVYSGPYIDVAPDIVVGYNSGYRSAWAAAVGKVGSAVFEDNVKAWSGDHCMDPGLVPGVVFCNRKFDAADPGIEDLAPTTLSLFGVKTPAYMEGQDLFAKAAAKARPAA